MSPNQSIHKFFLISSFFLAFLVRLPADIIADAEAQQKCGNTEQAVKLYREWLTANPDDKDFVAVYNKVHSLEKSAAEAETFLTGIIPYITDPVNRQTVYRKLAEIYLLSGNIELAQKNFERAALSNTEKKDYSSFLFSSRLLLEMGMTERAEAQAKTVLTASGDREFKNKAKILLMYSAFLGEDAAKGLKSLEELCDPQALSVLQPEDLGACYYLAKKIGRNDLTERISGVLKAKYPQSPEFSLTADDYRLSLVQSPLYLLGFSQEKKENVSSKHETVRVQTGLFTAERNAEQLLKRLQHDGFHAEIVKYLRDGKPFYKVVSPELEVENSQRYILRLKECGYEGFLLFQ